MPENTQDKLEDIYKEVAYSHINTGDKTIHAKRITGRFRTYKWYASA
ncbi:MAG: hypothetical protein Q9M10_03820 [Mariprofundaceae bacterium]|nr:hypothetical protein [Mariprofundaceae bacterium]